MVSVEFHECSFRYHRRSAWVLDSFRLAFGEGRTVLLGPNGAGKSTMLALAASVQQPQRGSVTLDGLVPDSAASRARFRERVAWMPQAVRPAAGVTVREQVALHGWLKGLSRGEAWCQAAAALNRVGLAELAARQAARLSGGQRARVGLAQALVHDASVVLLDEPTASLDPDQRERFVSLLAEISPSRAVVVSTHDVADIAAAYDRVVVLVEGRARFDGSVSDFLTRGATPTAVDAYRSVTGDSA